MLVIQNTLGETYTCIFEILRLFSSLCLWGILVHCLRLK